MLTEPFLAAKEILDKIEQNNHQAFFVGGSVRDFLLNRSIGDIDIATSATPGLIKQIFDKVIPVGIEHGTVIVRHNKESYEVTTFRIDGDYSDKRHPDSVKFIDKIEKDLERRDFTINALAMDKNGTVIDLFDGKKDLQHSVIRTVGNGFERFTEDPLRIIRALRFSSQLGFTIDPETVVQMKEIKQEIDNLAIERITNEITKLFKGSFINIGIAYLKRTEVFKHLPVLRDHQHIIEHLPKSLKSLYSFGEVIALFNHIEPSIDAAFWVKDWKCSNRTKQEAIQLIEALRYFSANGLDSLLVYKLDPEYYHGFFRLSEILYPNNPAHIDGIEHLYKKLPILTKSDLAVRGNDIIDLFPNQNKGPWLQEIISKLEHEVVLGNLKNTKKDLKEWIKWNPPEIN